MVDQATPKRPAAPKRPAPKTPANRKTVEQRLTHLEQQLDGISSQLQQLIDARRPLAELSEEMGPVAKAVMDTSIEQLAHLDERGYFAFARELRYALDRVVEDYDPADLHALADSSANILDTVKVATQPPLLAVVRDMVKAFDDADPEPVGAFGAVRKIGREKDIQRGIGFALDMLGAMGRSVSRAPRPSRSISSGAAQKALPKATRPAVSTPTAKKANDDFSYIEDGDWDESYAQRVADEREVGALTEAHWVLINFARQDFQKTGSAPNIRRITLQTDVSTREVYTLFPKAPGLTISRVAGIPKPVGCL